MEEIKKEFTEDYSRAVKGFNENDYRIALHFIRLMIEGLAKLLIYDFLGNDKASKLIVGKVSLNFKSDGLYSIGPAVGPKQDKTIEASALLDPIIKSYTVNHPDMADSKLTKITKRRKNEMENFINALKLFYSRTSALEEHTGNPPGDIPTETISAASTFLNFFNWLRENNIISDQLAIFLNSLEDQFGKFSFENNAGIQEKEDKIQELERKYEEQELALKEKDVSLQEKDDELETEKKKSEELQKRHEEQSLRMEVIRQENEQKELETKAQLAKSEEEKQALKEQIRQKDEIIDQLKQKHKKPQAQINTIPEKQSVVYKKNDWDVEEDSLDEDQIDLIYQTTDKSMLVTGCAGSGKSLIAAHKAELLFNQGENVILITLTKSLTDYMKSGKKDLPDNFYTHNRWKEKRGMPSADYIIVDEIQDFTEEEINEFIAATNKHFFFFGDTAQSIYRRYKETTTIERISELTGLDVLHLYNNYRLPRPVAKITEDYVGVNVQRYSEKNYKSEETELPHFIKYNSDDEQLDKIIQLVKEYEGKSVGILLPYNKFVYQVCEGLERKNVLFEDKFDEENSDTQRGRKKTYHYNLDYNTCLPKVMTYHSAKGVQFDVVILPLYNGATDELSQKELYVAMTRTVHCLYVLYDTPTLQSPLDKVPSDLYLKE